MRVTGRIINAPFCKRADGDNRVQWSRRRSHLPLVYLALMTRVDDKDAILKDRGLKVTSTKDFLGSSISRHVTATGTGVAVIQDPLSLLESKTMAKNRVSAETI